MTDPPIDLLDQLATIYPHVLVQRERPGEWIVWKDAGITTCKKLGCGPTSRAAIANAWENSRHLAHTTHNPRER